MPLIHSKSKGAIGKNIAKEEEAGKPHKQAVAIALNTARKAGANIKYKRSMKKGMAEHKKLSKTRYRRSMK